ncbi:hypothetical protein CRG98_029421 [Punica granatum]|uniref:Integrase catalytic domain-containing protein n=1 Tax=Punica granatum TaxID=22663 RepID=A0A2I0J1Q9_PUNGR|nr:hypothetical protein CRG98_029421 [Punica granatum]
MNQNGNGQSKKENGTTAVASDGETYIVCDEVYLNLMCEDSTWVANTETKLGCKLLLKKVRLCVKHNSDQVNVAEDYPIELWHMRLGHISEKVVEKETNMKLKCVRSDNGGEYRGPFENYCRTHGIKLEKTVPKTPQQNGLAERMNRTIIERVRCMLSQAKLSKSFWGEAIRIALILLILQRQLHLMEMYPSRASIHVPRDERSKLNAKTKQCIILGYAHEEFGYRFGDPNSRRIIKSRDVVFFEDQTIEDLQKLEKVGVSSPHEISIPIPVDVEHRVEEVPGEDEETMTGGEIPQVDDDVTEDDTAS